MNLDQLKKNLGQRVQLEPAACRLGNDDKELDLINDDWILDEASNEYLRISNIRTQHIVKLGKDHIHHYTSNPNRAEQGFKYGFLTLNVQIFLKGADSWVRPNAKPGERVSPHHKAPTPSTYDNKNVLRLSGHSIGVIEKIAKNNGHWTGTPDQFNVFAAKAIYGNEFGELMTSAIDYFSILIFDGYIEISSLTDHGNHPNGTPNTSISVELTDKAYEELGI